MRYQEASAKLTDYRRQIAALREKMRATQTAAEPEEVKNYAFATPAGTSHLADLFAGKSDLFVIHNMGASCPYCTVWADGFNGLYAHVADRAAFVVSSPDQPAQQQKFAAGRGWRFPMVSHAGSSFAADMGYRGEKGGWQPGVSVFKRDGGRILRVSDTGFEPGDDFCALWHFLDLIPGGKGDWEPDFRYG